MRALSAFVLKMTIVLVLTLAISGTVSPYLGYSPVRTAIERAVGVSIPKMERQIALAGRSR